MTFTKFTTFIIINSHVEISIHTDTTITTQNFGLAITLAIDLDTTNTTWYRYSTSQKDSGIYIRALANRPTVFNLQRYKLHWSFYCTRIIHFAIRKITLLPIYCFFHYNIYSYLIHAIHLPPLWSNKTVKRIRLELDKDFHLFTILSSIHSTSNATVAKQANIRIIQRDILHAKVKLRT